MSDNKYADFSFSDIFAMNQFAKRKQDSYEQMLGHFESRPDIYGELDIKRYKERGRRYAIIRYWTDKEMEARLLETPDLTS